MSRSQLAFVQEELAMRRLDQARAEARLDAARARIDELTGEILRMRREGFVPEPEPPRQDAAKPLDDKVLEAIEERAASATMRRGLRTYAERMSRNGEDASHIVKAILEGETFEEEFV